MKGPGGARRFVLWLIRYRLGILAVAAVLTIITGARTVLTYAALRSDLEELLPASAASVDALDELRRRVPGLRHLGVVVETGGREHAEAASRFLDDLAARVAHYPPELVEDVRVGVSAERTFAETYALQLMAPQDVVRLREAVEERRDWEIARRSGTDLLEDDEAPEIPLKSLREKYEKRYGTVNRFAGDRFVSDDGRSAVLLIQASSHDTGYDADAELLEHVNADVRDLGFPDRYAREMRVGFAGDVPTRVEEMNGLVADLSISGAVVALLVVGSILWFFRSLSALPILAVPLLLGTFGAFGVVALPPLSIRHLNSNTAFLASIVVGNGINSGIILLARFREERWQGCDLVESIVTAVSTTWRPTLAAASAAAAAYGSLITTDFRGFNQFGWIGGLGMLTCWASTYVLGPLMIFFSGSAIRGESAPEPGHRTGERFGRFLLSRPRATLVITGVLSVASLSGMWIRRADWLETDFSKLRRRDSWVQGERYWGGLMDRTMGRYLTPTVIMANDDHHAQVIADRLRVIQEHHGAGDLIAQVRSAENVLPAHRDRSIEEAKALKAVITPRIENTLEPEQRRVLSRALSDASMKPLAPDDLPKTLALGLRERNGSMGRNVLVFPKLTTGTWDARRISMFSDEIRKASSVDPQRPARAAGSLLLSSDIVAAMKTDGPRATAVALTVVVAIALLAFRSFGLSLAAVASLAVGVTVMLGALGWTGQRFNFSNFVSLPITFGIAADYSINVLKRFQADGEKNLYSAVSATGGAVALCSATTIIGYGSLLIAQNRALFSFGVFAVTGELACLATAVCALPALLWAMSKRAEPLGVSDVAAT